MRIPRAVRAVAFSALLAAALSAQFDPVDRVHPCQFLKCLTYSGRLGGDDYRAASDALTDVKHYKLDIEILPDTQTVQGKSEITATSTVDGLAQMDIHLDPNFDKMAVLGVGGNAASYSWTGDVVTLTLDRAYNQGEQFTVTVDYAGQPREGGFGSFNWAHHGSGQYYNWSISSLSQPFFARAWWPCKDVLADKADSAEVWVTVPDPLFAVSNGLFQGADRLSGNRSRYRWTENYPIITYLISVAISNYSLYQQSYNHLGAQMPCEYYLFPEHDYNNSPSRQGCDVNVTQIEKFADVFGQYPFINERYGMAEVAGAGTYMEHQTCSSMLNTTNEPINAHELAHQWWGDEVTCASWADIWLNEGFATYSEAIWYEQKYGGSHSAYMQQMMNNYPGNPDDRVLRTRLWDSKHIFSGTVYNKGAWVLHMLRGMLGDAAFFKTLADYRAKHRHASAVTADFAEVCSQNWGRDSTFFFDQWIMRYGSPDYEYNWRDDVVNGAHRLRLALWQIQRDRGYDIFTMPVRIRVSTDSGNVDFTLWNDDWERVYDLPLPASVRTVTVDPDTWLLVHGKVKTATPLPAIPLMGDMNNDGRVNIADVAVFKKVLNGEITNKLFVHRADFDYNGIVNSIDEAAFNDVVRENGSATPKKR